MILVSFFKGFWSTFFYIFENGEIVKISTASKRELNFQGLAGSVFVYFLLFFGVWFLDGFGDGFLVILGWILGPLFCKIRIRLLIIALVTARFRSILDPKIDETVIDFGIDF